jgi:hypothetical protein
VSPTPAAFSEAISPRGKLQEERVLGASTLQIRMFFGRHFLVELYFGLDIHELLANTSICARKVAQFAETL